MSDLGQSSTKILCQSKYNTAPSLGIEQTEASTDKAVSVFTHTSSVVTRALTTTAGSETHHQHQDAGAFTRRQHASLGRGSGDSADSPHRRGSKWHIRQRHLRLEAAVRSILLAQTGRETGAGVSNESRGKHCSTPCPAPHHPQVASLRFSTHWSLPPHSLRGASQLCPKRLPSPHAVLQQSPLRLRYKALEGHQARAVLLYRLSPVQPGLPHAVPVGKRSHATLGKRGGINCSHHQSEAGVEHQD